MSYKWRAFIAIGLSFITLVMATAMVFVLLPAIAEDFDVTLGAVGWVVIVESLIISALLLPLGRLADTFGRRRIHLVGLSVFGLGAVFTGLAPSFAVLIAARMIMALGNAMVQSVNTGMLVAAFPETERGKALGAQTTSVAVGSASGPLIGGYALEFVTWEVLFLLLSIPVVLSLIAAVVILKNDSDRTGMTRPGPFDRRGALLSAVAVVALVVTISNPFALPWLSPATLAGTVLFVVAISSFVRWELRYPEPMLQLRLFKIPLFRAAVLVRLLGFVASTTTTLLLPIFLVSIRGLAAGLAGAVLFLLAAGTGIAAQISGRLFDRVGPRPASIAGLCLQILVSFVLFTTDADTPMALIAVTAFFAGLGVGLWNVSNNSAMMVAIPPDNLGVGGAFTNVTRTIGTVLGQAVTSAVVVGVMVSRDVDVPLGDIETTVGAGAAFIDGWRAAYLVAIAVSVTALVTATRLPAAKDPTMRS